MGGNVGIPNEYVGLGVSGDGVGVVGNEVVLALALLQTALQPPQ